MRCAVPSGMTRTHSRIRYGFALSTSLLLMAGSGCKSKDRSEADTPTAMTPAAPQPNPTPADPGAQPADPANADPQIAIITVTAIDIDTKLAVMCGIPESDVFFKYDSAQVLPEAKARLDRIAACAVDGAAKGKDLLVVGRAGPVGSDQFNKELGMNRAEAVSKYLSEQGVAKSRVAIESKGEAAANEAVPASWPYERRVTLRLQG